METDQQSKTEAPTLRRREEARKKGDVALSRDLVAGFGLLAAVGVLTIYGSEMGGRLLGMVRAELLGAHMGELQPQQLIALFRANGNYMLLAIGSLIGVVMATHVFVVVLQTGWKITSKPLQPDWNRINPVKGLSRLFSSTSAMRGLQAVMKTLVLIIVILIVFRSMGGQIATAPLGALDGAVATAWQIALRTSAMVALALVLLGLSDYAFQRWKFENQLRMTRQEVRDERKEEEGDPLIRARIKRVQRDLSRKRMLRDVVTATAVITNPTHYAIALKYEMESMSAPKVVAKGVDEVARSIREIAIEHDVPILERRELARTLYKTVEVGDEIPHVLYHAIAEIVAYLHRTGRFR